MHTKNQLIASLTMGNEAIDHLLDRLKNDEELLRAALDMLIELRVNPDICFGPAFAMLTTRKAQLERKLQQRLGRV